MKNRVRILRMQKGLTQKELSQIIRVKQSAVSKWETGRATPDSNALKLLSRYFNVSIDFLVGNEVEINQTPQLTMHEQYVLSLFNALSDKAQSLAVSYLEGMYAGEHQVVPIIINNKEN